MLSEKILTLIKSHHTKESGDLQLRKSLDAIAKENITLIHKDDPSYPRSLLELKHPPKLLYVKGTLPKNLNHAITIVGTRTASNYGKEQSYKFAKELSAAHMPILSGLARGIDSQAHRGALEGGQTVAIIGSGHCNLYPKENYSLAQEICKQGAIISEYPPFLAPTSYTFVQRNRLLAALGKASILIESPEKGGSMITMEIAHTLQRPLFALPATVDRPSFKGNFQLIKEKKAQLIDSSKDLFAYFNLILPKKDKEVFFDLNKEEQVIYNILMGQEKEIGELVLLTQYPIMKLNILLTSLLLRGVIKECAGKVYSLHSNF